MPKHEHRITITRQELMDMLHAKYGYEPALRLPHDVRIRVDDEWTIVDNSEISIEWTDCV